MRIKKFSQCLLGASGLGLFIMSCLLLNPVQISLAQAEEEITRAEEQDVRVYVQPVVSVSLKERMDIGVIPKSGGTFKAETATVRIATNNITGYNVFLQTASTETALVNSDATISAKINTIASETDQNGFADNTWGYNFDTANADEATIFKPIPNSAGEAIASSDKSTTSDSYNLTFGTKINTDLPAGEYVNSVVLSVVANPMAVTSLTQLTVMQDMTNDICTNSVEGAKAQLTDIRDGNVYWVEKLKDGNCWMTQNLAISFKDFEDGQGMRAIASNGSPGAILTRANTDLNKDSSNANLQSWQGQATRFSYATDASVGYTVTSSWNLGKYVLADPTDTSPCGTMSSATLAGCAKAGFVDVSDDTLWRPDFSATIGTWDGKEQLVAVQFNNPNAAASGDYSAGGVYDAHYLVGNYYSFNTATAGTGSSLTNGYAPSSICPKGWKLPTTGSGSGTFYGLLNQYGLTSTIESTNKEYNIAAPPLSFVRGGRVYAGDYPAATSFGGSGAYWTDARGPSNVNAYLFTFYNTVTPSTHDTYRYIGFSVRCLAR